MLHWPELEEPTDIVSIVVQDWFIIQDYQTQKHQMNIEYWFTHAQIVQKTLKNQRCFQ